MTAANSTTYQWDAANRLKSVNNGSLGSYGYDGNGKRVKKTESGTTTYYVYSSFLDAAVMEVTSTGVQRAYVSGGRGKMVALLSPDGNFYWIHQDHLGSEREMTNSSGTVIYRAEFDPYGKLLYEWSSSNQPNLNTKKFTGYERDTATSLDYAQARYYSADWGRFMSPDPIGLKAARADSPKSLNRYSYVENNPINYRDPNGTNLEYIDAGPNCYILISWTTFEWGSWGTWTKRCLDLGGGGGGGGGGEQLWPIVPFPTGADLVKEFDTLIAKGDCKDYVTKLINKAAEITMNPFHSNDVKELYGKIKEFRFNENLTGLTGGTVDGYIKDGNAVVIIGPERYQDLNSPVVAQVRQIYAQKVLHEIIHHAGKNGYYYDNDMARAVKAVGGLSEAQERAYAEIKFDGSDEDNNRLNRFWNSLLTQHCPDK